MRLRAPGIRPWPRRGVPWRCSLTRDPVTLDALAQNLLSPLVLAFALGVAASFLRSDLRLPDALYASLSIYLLFAIGLKGGVALSQTPLEVVALPALGTLALGIATPLVAFAVLRRLRFGRADAGALAAHYGSVSAVTFLAAIAYVTAAGHAAEGFMPTLVALLEVPAIVVGLLLATARRGAASADSTSNVDAANVDAAGVGRGGAASGRPAWRVALHDVLTGRSIVLLVGGLVVGTLAGERGMAPVAPFFVAGFQGALTLFLLEMGIVAAARLRDLRAVGVRLVGFAIGMPLVHGALGVAVGQACGLGIGGSAVLGAMASSASYIAAPAAVRMALPEASPTLYLTAALGVTFPFNLALGLPLYLAFAVWLAA